jgi:hypothetical protein
MSILNYFGARAKTNRNQWWLPAMEIHRREEGDGWDDEVSHFADSGSPTGGESERPPLSYDALTATGGPSVRRRVYDPSTATGDAAPVVEAGSSARQMRPRVADPEQFTEDRINTLRRMPLEHVGFKQSAGMALQNFGNAVTQGLQYAAASGRPMTAYDAMNVIGAGISSGAPMLAPRVASQAMRNEEIGTNQRRLLDFERARQKMAARADAALKQRQGVANYDKTLAEIADIKDRPLREREKIGASTAKAEQARVFRILTSLKGQRLDPDNPLVRQLRDDAERAGMPFDVDSFNDSKGNVVRYTKTDPEHPGQTVEVERNVVTGEESVLGQGRYQKPVGEDGMTAGERGNLGLGSARFGETKRHNRATEAQGGERIGIARQGLSLRQAAQDNRFDSASQKRFDSADKLAAQAEEYARTAQTLNDHDTYIDPDTHEQKTSAKRDIDRDKFIAKADAARRQLFTTYRDVFEQGPDGRVRMTTAEFKSLFPTLAAKPSGEYIGVAQRAGVELTDGPTASPGAYTPSPIRRPTHRAAGPGAPASAPSEGKTHVSRAKFRAKYADYKDRSDADVDAAIRSSGFEPMP